MRSGLVNAHEAATDVVWTWLAFATDLNVAARWLLALAHFLQHHWPAISTSSMPCHFSDEYKPTCNTLLPALNTF